MSAVRLFETRYESLMDVFVSVGTGLSPEQEQFVHAVESRLRALGLEPKTIGRNTFTVDAPLRAVKDLMDGSRGVVVIALERFQFPRGVERAGSAQERELADVRLPTVWNQIEAAMAYVKGLPLLVIVDENIRADGLLEKGNDWFVQSLAPTPAALDGDAFTGILANWRDRLPQQTAVDSRTGMDAAATVDPASMSIGQLFGALKPGQLWAVVLAAAAIVAAAFAWGVNSASSGTPEKGGAAEASFVVEI